MQVQQQELEAVAQLQRLEDRAAADHLVQLELQTLEAVVAETKEVLLVQMVDLVL